MEALRVTQMPVPGESRVMYCGDCVVFFLELSSPEKGRAWIRTNLGSAAIARQEVIRRVERDEIKLDEAWYDVEMEQTQDRVYKIVLPLHETGFFQAKCFFLPHDHSVPVWPPGGNCILNVEPAGTCCANIIYNAFVRQFGPSKSNGVEEPDLPAVIQRLDAKGYTVIPGSGKFRDLKNEVEFIFERLGCRVLHLLPIHPTPTTYARMGRFGSPYAALNFTDVDPALAEFDSSATPLEQFMELVDRVHYHNGYVFMDIAINHTGWAASIHETHPEWLVRGEDGQIQAPGAWGVVWADLTRLDYSNIDLWKYMADVFLLWCHRGVDGFRCDAGYMIPVKAWEYIVAKVRQEYPETLFFLEGLGGPVETTRNILSRANFNWAYSELFQTYTRQEISDYLPIACDISNTCGHTIHFAETHDNNRLASVSTRYAQMRTSLCALFSVCGGFGFANGVEWFADRKIDVHESAGLNWGNENNQVDHISRLNLILKNHPAFFGHARLSLIGKNDSQSLVLLRTGEQAQKRLLVLINLDCEGRGTASWLSTDAGFEAKIMLDLITGERFEPDEMDGLCHLTLAPGQALALTPDPEDRLLVERDGQTPRTAPATVYLQKLKTKVLAVHTIFRGYKNLGSMDVEEQARAFAHDPIEFIRSYNTPDDPSFKHESNQIWDGESNESRVIIFDVQRDLKRQVMVPPGFFLLVKCSKGFRAEILDENRSTKTSLGYEEGLLTGDGQGFFALFPPLEAKNQHRSYTLLLRIFEAEKTLIHRASLLYLAPLESLYMSASFTRKEIVKTPFLKLLGTTSQGGMMRAAAWWGRLDSRYDAFLGANLDKATPENRWQVLSRCRIWAVFQGYSRQLSPDCLERFTFSYGNGGKWLFHVPTSEGKYYALELVLDLDPGDNHVRLTLFRTSATPDRGGFLEDHRGVTLIIRPDIEDRSFHETVKAFKGPETQWPDAVTPVPGGVFFSLSRGTTLALMVSKGEFIHEPEWHYMIHRAMEAQRGLDADSDLFSPGYFTFALEGGETVCLDAAVIDPEDEPGFRDKNSASPESRSFETGFPLFEAVCRSLDAFIVDRGRDKSVIAGFPWFLDWGRDSLIFCRSLIELGRFAEAKSILRLFGRFENKGTLPNMICGEDARNIETSDAPLWFFACCKDLVEQEKNLDFLNEVLDHRSVKDILLSIAHSLIQGTRTGVKADPETLLLYSPSHFTWMDTNFPAGSPRQGYPVEIQAMWYNALVFLARMDEPRAKEWQKKAEKVQDAVHSLFYIPTAGFFSDCLHSDGPDSGGLGGAKNAHPDDALRPNQLFLVTFDVIRDKTMVQGCVETCLELLVPGAIRSLADRRLETPINIYYNGNLIKDPFSPYSGEYRGDEDTQRKPAYHNGTAWTWPFPVFCEAWAAAFGKRSRSTCLAWLGSVILLMRKGAAGYIPEIIDGDFPHTPRGCDAQAWGSSEFARVMHKLSQ